MTRHGTVVHTDMDANVRAAHRIPVAEQVQGTYAAPSLFDNATQLDRVHADESPAGAAKRDRALRGSASKYGAIIDKCRAHVIRLYEERRAKAIRAGAANQLALDTMAFVSGDDATRFLDEYDVRDGDRRGIVGNVFKPNSGWRAVGYANSTLKKRHSRPVQRWAWHAYDHDAHHAAMRAASQAPSTPGAR